MNETKQAALTTSDIDVGWEAVQARIDTCKAEWEQPILTALKTVVEACAKQNDTLP